MSLVVLDEVTLFFADRMIFDAVSLRLGHGDRIGLIGPNGSGKTTLLKVIAGEQDVDDGLVTRANGVRVGWLGGVFAGTRTIFRRAHRRAEALADLFQILVTEIESSLSTIAARDERAR